MTARVTVHAERAGVLGDGISVGVDQDGGAGSGKVVLNAFLQQCCEGVSTGGHDEDVLALVSNASCDEPELLYVVSLRHVRAGGSFVGGRADAIGEGGFSQEVSFGSAKFGLGKGTVEIMHVEKVEEIPEVVNVLRRSQR